MTTPTQSGKAVGHGFYTVLFERLSENGYTLINDMPAATRKERANVFAQRDELLEALREAQRMLQADAPGCALEAIETAIAKTTGSKA